MKLNIQCKKQREIFLYTAYNYESSKFMHEILQCTMSIPVDSLGGRISGRNLNLLKFIVSQKMFGSKQRSEIGYVQILAQGGCNFVQCAPAWVEVRHPRFYDVCICRLEVGLLFPGKKKQFTSLYKRPICRTHALYRYLSVTLHRGPSAQTAVGL